MSDYDKRVGTPNQQFGKDTILPPAAQKLTTHDHFGLSLDPKDWAKAKCNTCYGQGVFLNTRAVPAKEMVKGATGSGNVTRTTEPCGCAVRAYQRVMLTLQDRVLAVWHHPDTSISQEKREEAVQAMVAEALKQVRNAGKITSVKAMVQAADQAARSRIVTTGRMPVLRGRRR